MMSPQLYDELHDALSDIYEAMLDNKMPDLHGFSLMEVEDALDGLEMEQDTLNRTQLNVCSRALEHRTDQLKESRHSTVGLTEEDEEYFDKAIALSESAYRELHNLVKSL